ncbi:MAG: hypothetical protein Q9226_000219 [Calogaya cf. arnoldii]
MSQTSTPTGRAEKTMSSRLMTMKFMQRAAASSSMPSPQSHHTPHGDPPSKRRKTSTAQSPLIQPPIPGTPTTDAQIFQAAVDAEDAKRAAAIERVAAQAGGTKWVLSTAEGAGKPNSGEKQLQFLTAGYSEIDQDIETRGRRTFGRYKTGDEQQDGTANRDTGSPSGDEENIDGDDDIGTDSEDDDGDTVTLSMDPPGNREFIRAEDNPQTSRKGRTARKADTNNTEMQKQQEVRLNNLTSISGGGGGRSGGGGLAGIECHFCGEKGHRKANCAKRARLDRRREDR